MKRVFVIIFLFLLCPLSLNAKIITGEVEFNAEDAREEIFSSPAARPDLSFYRQYLIDENNRENLNYLLQGITQLKDRKLAKFSDGSYGVQYYDDPMYSWYYSANGRLINFTEKDSASYPCKIVKYKPDGSIANRGYRVSSSESYLFSKDGKLLAHWVGENCYDDNNIIMKRKLYN